MAGGNKLEILLSVKAEDSPINKLKAKMQSLLPAASKVEEKLSKIGKKVDGSGLEKLKSKMNGITPVVNRIGESFNNLKTKIATSFNGKLFNLGDKIINSKGVNAFSNALEKIPIIGGKIANSFDMTRDKINGILHSGNILKSGFTVIGEKIKRAFKPENLKKFGSALKDIGNKIKGIIEKLGGLLGKLGAIGGIVGGISFAGIAKASDEHALRNSRMKMVTNDVGGLREKVYASSKSSHGDYNSQLDQVTKLKMLTRGMFSDNEAVKFTGTLQKAFKIAGVGAEDAAGAMYQLNQAMVSGRLQGDEFTSINERAPIIMQKIADSMGIPMSKLKEMGSKGKITADVIKKAMLGSASEIDAKFAEMPITFADIWQDAKSTGQKAMEGLLTKVNEKLNSPMGQKLAQNLQGAFTSVAGIAGNVFDGMFDVFEKLNFAPLLEPLKGIGQTLSQAFSGVGGEGLTDGIANGLNMIIGLAGQVAGVIAQMISGIDFGQIGQIFGDIGNAVMTLFANLDFGSIGNMLTMAFQQTIQTISMITPALAPIMQILAVIINLVVQIGTALLPIAGIFAQIGAAMIAAIVPVAQVIIGVFAGVVGAIVGVFSAIIGIVASIMGAVLAVIVGIINSIGAAVNKIATFFTTNFNKAKSVAQGAINAIKGFFNGLASTVSSIASKIAGMFNVKPPSWLGFLGGGKGRYIGDKSWEGGPVTVAEKGAEMIRLPSGQQFLANEEMTMNLPQGTRISTAEATRKMMRDQFGKSSKRAIDGKKSSSGSKSNNGGSSQNIFSPTIVVENSGGNDKELTRKIERILRRFFEEKYLAMGG